MEESVRHWPEKTPYTAALEARGDVLGEGSARPDQMDHEMLRPSLKGATTSFMKRSIERMTFL